MKNFQFKIQQNDIVTTQNRENPNFQPDKEECFASFKIYLFGKSFSSMTFLQNVCENV